MHAFPREFTADDERLFLEDIITRSALSASAYITRGGGNENHPDATGTRALVEPNDPLFPADTFARENSPNLSTISMTTERLDRVIADLKTYLA